MAASEAKAPSLSQCRVNRPQPKAKATSANSVLNSIATSYYRLCGPRPFPVLRHCPVLPKRKTWERHSKEIERILGQAQGWAQYRETVLFVEPRIHARFSVRKLNPKITPRRGPVSARLLTPQPSSQKEYCEGLSIAPLVAVTQRHNSLRKSASRLKVPRSSEPVGAGPNGVFSREKGGLSH